MILFFTDSHWKITTFLWVISFLILYQICVNISKMIPNNEHFRQILFSSHCVVTRKRERLIYYKIILNYWTNYYIQNNKFLYKVYE